jgi:sporulation protein YlmC with PRC-barrel domain
MSVQSTTDTGRSLLGEALHWALPRLAIYILGSLAGVLAFTIWAAWPDKPVPVRPAPSIDAPALPRSMPVIVPGGDGPAISQVPPDAFPIVNLHKLEIYDPNNARIGQIQDVLFNPEGKVVFFIVGVGSGFLGEEGKDIAVPAQAVQFKKKDDNTWMPVLNMSKDAVQNAPRQTFDPATMKWKFVPTPARP